MRDMSDVIVVGLFHQQIANCGDRAKDAGMMRDGMKHKVKDNEELLSDLTENSVMVVCLMSTLPVGYLLALTMGTRDSLPGGRAAGR
jgi:hypothetical protein